MSKIPCSGDKIEGIIVLENSLGKSSEIISKSQNSENIVREYLVNGIQQIAEKMPPEIDRHKDFWTGKHRDYFWQFEQYGKKLEKNTREQYRGYFMVEKEDLPELIQILRELGVERKRINKDLNFKWLLASNFLTSPESESGNFYGKYFKLKETDPIAVIYADSNEGIQEIIQTITTNPRWREKIRKISEKRSQPKIKSRRPGTNAYIDPGGYEWRAICYNDKPGISENEAADLDWREQKNGDYTI